MKKDTLMVHCLATPRKWAYGKSGKQIMDTVDAWHKERGWAGIGYHAVILPNGMIMAGRENSKPAAAAKGWNTRGIHVALTGGHGSAADDSFADHYTPDQDKALRKYIKGITAQFRIKKLMGHNEVAKKACPGFDVRKWYNNRPRKRPLNRLLNALRLRGRVRSL